MHTRRIVRALVAFLLAACACTAAAQSGGYYEPLRAAGQVERDNDPFVFCRYGLKHRPRAWSPVPDYVHSTPLPTPGYCPYPSTSPCCAGNVCLKAWTQEEFDAFFLYKRVCLQAEQSGTWRGSGNGTQSPYSH